MNKEEGEKRGKQNKKEKCTIVEYTLILVFKKKKKKKKTTTTKRTSLKKKQNKKYSVAHSRVATLIQPSFQKNKTANVLTQHPPTHTQPFLGNTSTRNSLPFFLFFICDFFTFFLTISPFVLTLRFFNINTSVTYIAPVFWTGDC